MSNLYLLYMKLFCVFFFFNDTATTEIYTLSLHDALPIPRVMRRGRGSRAADPARTPSATPPSSSRSEEHTSELQSHVNLVCRLLLEKKKTIENLFSVKKKEKNKQK